MTDAPRIVPETVIHARNDVDAKAAYVLELEKQGFAARVTRSPADITAEKDGIQFFFEIKKTSQAATYFGAATLTEWEAALRYPDRYFFVTAQVVIDGWVFHSYNPAEFMRFSTVPPFKIFFDISVGAERAVANDRKTRSVRLTSERVADMVDLFGRWQRDDETTR